MSSGQEPRILREVRSYVQLYPHGLTVQAAVTSRRSLPQLLIPSTPHQHDENNSPSPHTPSSNNNSSATTSPASTQTITPDTPISLRSPVSGVIDLTDSITTLEDSPVTTGGFSDIYRGEWTKESPCPGRQGETVPVAIKLLRFLAVSDQEKTRKKLNWEVYIWHRLEHPNIVQLFGTSYHMSGRPAMIMQWYKNGSAIEYLRRDVNRNVDRKTLVLDVAQGLNYLHTLTPPIIHGDLKGNNVLITDDGHAVLSDFGLAQMMGTFKTGFTPSNPDFGPLRWQAPELLEDDACQPGLATDVWSFGCTAYEILSGNLPYPNRQREALVVKDVHSGIKPSGPAGLQALLAATATTTTTNELDHQRLLHDVIDCCWSYDPSGRCSMATVVSKLENF